MSTLNRKSSKHVNGNQELEQPKQEGAFPPSSTRTIKDLPPELLTKILEFLTLDATEQKNIFGYRLVNLEWKDIMDSLIEKRIVSAEFKNSPIINVEGARYDFQVCVNPTRFTADRNPFPFNSLQLNRKDSLSVSNNAPECSNYPILGLEAFASRFGGNLTSLALCGLRPFPISLMVTMLSSMASLKLLSLEDVTSEDENSFPAPPPLPCLSTLELVTRRTCNRINNHCGWLFASYADKLVRLHLLQSSTLYPPLQAGHQYTYLDANDATRVIATTSESAFRNLKELKISHPSRNFLLLSETPALQHFSLVYGEYVYCENFDLDHVNIFIDRCGSTLETLVLSYPWNYLSNSELFKKFNEGHRPLFLPTSLIVVPRLKSLAVYYPDTDKNETVLSEFLAKFPALEKLEFLHFQLNRFDLGIQIEDLNLHQNGNNEGFEVGNNNIQLADNIGALKEQLPPLFEYLSEISKNQWVAEDALARLRFHPEDDVEEQVAVADKRQLEAEIKSLKLADEATRKERAAIFRRLAALGVNTRKVMVEQLLERGGYWNTCPRLRIVSVSNGEKPIGDVCVIRRTDNA